MKGLRKTISAVLTGGIFTVLLSAVAFAEGEAAATTTGTGAGYGTMIISIVLMLAVFYFLLIRPQKKKEKEAKNMRDSLTVGDELVTIGGIVGKVLKIKDDEITVETGSDKNRITVKKWAINNIVTVKDAPAGTSKKKAKDDDPDSYLDEYVDETEGKNK